MSSVVQFLEDLSKVAFSNQHPHGECRDAIAALDADPRVRDALLSGDVTTLSALLGGRATMTFILVPAENEEPKEDEEQSEPDGDETGISSQFRAA